MSSSPSQIRLREARKEEIPLLVSMLINAFRGRAMNEAFFPERLRVRDGDADQLSFRSERMEKQYAARDEARQADPDEKRPQCHYLVAVEVLEEEGSGSSPEGGEETIVGYAEWVGHRGAAPAPNSKESGDKAAAAAQPGLTEEERAEEEEKKKEKKRKREAERIAALPPSLDREAVDTAQKETAVLEGTLKEALGEEGFANSWCLDAISVDPAHQRKGIGKMLMQYGEERAEKDGKNIRFMASESGAKMYRALGYEEVGSREILGGMEYAFVRRARK